MPNLTRSCLIAAAILTAGTAFAATAGPRHNPANAISLLPDHPDSFLHFAPELPQMRARAAPINTDLGLHVSEIEPGLFFVTDLIYQSAFVVTGDGVVVLDAPPSFGPNLRRAIEQAAPGVPITHLILSHGHRDHNGGGTHFTDIVGLEVVAAADVAATLEIYPLDGVPTPTRTFDDRLDLSIGGVAFDLRAVRFHSEDTDVLIHLPEQGFLMAVDTITPGEAPFMNFGATTDLNAYLAAFDTFLAYDFRHFLSGHVSVLGNRQDVIAARDYAFDVRDTVLGLMPTFGPRMSEGLEAVAYQNANLAYRYAMEQIRDECAAEIIDRWQGELSVVNLWADSHCETVLLHAVMH